MLNFESFFRRKYVLVDIIIPVLKYGLQVRYVIVASWQMNKLRFRFCGGNYQLATTHTLVPFESFTPYAFIEMNEQ